MGGAKVGPAMRGRLGPGHEGRTHAITGDLPSVLSGDNLAFAAMGAVPWANRVGASWSPTPLPAHLEGPAEHLAREHDAVSVVDHGTSVELHPGVSGAVPVYFTVEDGRTVYFSSTLEPLTPTTQLLRPDWDAWAQILAAGAPLDGRTPFTGIRRLKPWQRVTVSQSNGVMVDDGRWRWLDIEPHSSRSIEPVLDALHATVAEIGDRAPLAPLLSGGWDSRLLTALATTLPGGRDIIARTTSSDTGTVMEELVAAQVAEHLGIHHDVVFARRDEFAADVGRFARAVDYQASFHIWLVPLAQEVAASTATVLDGLGGGLFLGGAFPDPPSAGSVIDRRFRRMTHYLQSADAVLAPSVIQGVRDRTRTGFEAVAQDLVDHPFGNTFTAYLTRTVPGISLAPYGLVTGGSHVATPFVHDRVVSAALALPPDIHRDGAMYSALLNLIDEVLAELPTAESLAPWPRPHPRRIASFEAASYLRLLCTQEPVGALLAADLRRADISVWQRMLSLTGPQHLIRGLAMLSLWWQEYADRLADDSFDGLLESG